MMTKKEREFYKVLLEERWPLVSLADAKVGEPVQDRDGCFTSMSALNHRFVGVARFMVDRDVSSFRMHLAKSARLRLSHFVRAQGGEPIDPSFLSMSVREARRGIFRDGEDKHLCVWGVGLANLARQRDIEIRVTHQMLPAELIR